jgi:hypothetical protein
MKIGDQVITTKEIIYKGQHIAWPTIGTVSSTFCDGNFIVTFENIGHCMSNKEMEFVDLESLGPVLELYVDQSIYSITETEKYQWLYKDKYDFYHLTSQKYKTKEEAQAVLLPTDKVLRSFDSNREG